MSGPQGELIDDMIATTVPREVAHPHGKNPFALEDGAATRDPGYAKRASVDVEAIGERSASVIEREMYPPPTMEEASTLRKVSGSIPAAAYLLCLVEFAERASYYGVQTIFSNFMQFPLPKGGNGAGAPPKGTQETAGALGKGLQFSNALGLLFLFLAYLIPIFGGWVADTKLGRYKTIMYGVLICAVSHIIMICGAIPSVLQAGHGIAPFMVSFFLLAVGAGIFKPNIAPTVLDQYKHQKPYIQTLKSGERVIIDPETTIQRIMLIFYALVNVGAFYAIATTYSEKYVGYWLAFLTPGIIYFMLPALLIFLSNKIVKYPPDGSALTTVFKIITMAFKQSKFMVWKKGFWDAAKPSTLAERGVVSFNNKPISWTDKDVEDVRRTMVACAIFLYFPIYNINDGGVGSVSTSQGSTMTTNGAPNDLLGNFNSLTIIIVIPILSYVIYPLLAKYRIKFGRISRVAFGFHLTWISGVIGAIVQWRVYETSPCGYYATGCETGTGVSPLSIWWQIPNVSLGAVSECFCNVTAYELAYARSPPGMKALVMAVFLAMRSLSSLLGIVLTPAITDPYLIWIWAGPAIALFVQTMIFHWHFRSANHDEFMLEAEDPQFRPAVERTSEADADSNEGPRGETEKDLKV